MRAGLTGADQEAAITLADWFVDGEGRALVAGFLANGRAVFTVWPRKTWLATDPVICPMLGEVGRALVPHQWAATPRSGRSPACRSRCHSVPFARALAVGLPLAYGCAASGVRGAGVGLWVAHSLAAIPTVVIGLTLYLLLSASGPLGWTHLLYTRAAMAGAQFFLAAPIVVGCRARGPSSAAAVRTGRPCMHMVSRAYTT